METTDKTPDLSNVVNILDYNKNSTMDIFEYTIRRTVNLTRNELHILFILHIFGGRIDRELFNTICSRSFGILQLIDISNVSENYHEFVHIDDYYLSTCHDKILDAVSVLEQIGLEQIGEISFKADFDAVKVAVARFLETSIKNPSNQSHLTEIYWRLCKLYLDTNQEERVAVLLDDLPNDLLTSGRIDKFVELLKNVEDVISSSSLSDVFKEKFFRKLVKVYNHSGNDWAALNCAQRFINLERIDNSIDNLLMANLLDLTSQHDKALNFIYNKLYLDNISLDLELAYKLSEIMCLRSLNMHDKCEEKYRSILLDDKYKSLDDYAIALRCAEMVLPFREAEPLIVQSINLLYNQGRFIEAGRAAVICGFVRTVIEEYNAAYEILNKAELLLDECISDRQSLLNNQAVLSMYKGYFTQDVEEKLLQAKLSAKPEYDQIVLSNNMLIFSEMVEQDSTWLAASLEKLLDTVSVSDKDIRRILHFNLSQYYKSKDKEKYTIHLNKSKFNHVSYLADGWEQIWSEENWYNIRYKGTGKLPYIPTFLSYWTYDISKLL